MNCVRKGKYLESLEYLIEKRVGQVRSYPDDFRSQISLQALALGNEVGELQGEVKKFLWYGDKDEPSGEQLESMKSELTDSFFHIVALCNVLEMPLLELDHRLRMYVKRPKELKNAD